jgi:hypothetical protein
MIEDILEDLIKSEEKKPLNKPMRSDRPGKKKKVYVKDPSTGNIKTVHYGDTNYKHNYSKEANKNFRSRHNCSEKKDKTKPGYWACRDLWPTSKKSEGDNMNQLEKLGIKIGTQRLIDDSVHKSEVTYDPSLQVVRKGAGISPRDILEQQISKGNALIYKEPKLVRRNFHADAELDSDDQWEKKRREDEAKADAEYEKEHHENPSVGSHGEQFHSDADGVDYAITEVDREFGRESRPMKSKATRDTYIGDDQGEKQYTYKSSLFLKAIGACDDLIEKATSCKADPIEKMAQDARSIKKEKMSKKQMMMVANLHENSDGVAEQKKAQKAQGSCWEGYERKPGTKKYSEGSCVKKSALDELVDIVKGEYFEKKAPRGVDPEKHERCVQQVKRQGKNVGSAHAICTSAMKKANDYDYNKDGKLDEHEKDHKKEEKRFQRIEEKVGLKKKKNFIKSQGQGGIIFDFGWRTGNPMADQATELLNRHADSIQINNAKYQQEGHEKALNNFVNKGEKEFMVDHGQPFGEFNKESQDMLNKPMDQQVAEAFAKGQLDNKVSTPAVTNDHNNVQIGVGGEVIKATSETDAALIEMMKAQGIDLSNMTMDGVADCSTAGATRVIAGLE